MNAGTEADFQNFRNWYHGGQQGGQAHGGQQGYGGQQGQQPGGQQHGGQHWRHETTVTVTEVFEQYTQTQVPDTSDGGTQTQVPDTPDTRSQGIQVRTGFNSLHIPPCATSSEWELIPAETESPRCEYDV